MCFQSSPALPGSAASTRNIAVKLPLVDRQATYAIVSFRRHQVSMSRSRGGSPKRRSLLQRSTLKVGKSAVEMSRNGRCLPTEKLFHIRNNPDDPCAGAKLVRAP